MDIKQALSLKNSKWKERYSLYKYMVWGKIHGSDVLIKLYGDTKRRTCVSWMNKNKKYYDDMRIYEFCR